jgi:hypothetical protein
MTYFSPFSKYGLGIELYWFVSGLAIELWIEPDREADKLPVASCRHQAGA